MQIEVTTDHHIEGGERLNDHISGDVESSLGHFADHLTRVEAHLVDESAGKNGGDHIRCTLEARPEREKPLVVTSHGASVDDALASGLEKLERLLDHHFGKKQHHKGGETLRHSKPI